MIIAFAVIQLPEFHIIKPLVASRFPRENHLKYDWPQSWDREVTYRRRTCANRGGPRGIAARHLSPATLEPLDRIADFDRMRQHYVAFSRARDVLILTAAATPAAHFNTIWEGLPRWPNLDTASRERLLDQRFGAEHSSETPAPPSDLVIPSVKRLIVRQGASGTLRAKPG